MVLNDLHIEKKYSPRSNAVCTTYGGCCTDLSGKPESKKDEAGFWGSNQGDSICDIPRYTYVETLKEIKRLKE